MYWVDIQLAQRKGLKFYQTRCNAIILPDTLPACCISKVVVMDSGEIIYQKMYVSPRPPQISTKIIGCVIWILMSLEAAKIPNESNQNPKPNYQSRRDPYWWIKTRSTKLISEYQDCHTQLERKQNISEFESSSKRIEIHPHRAARQADLQLKNVYNPFSKVSKEMIRELGNVDLFKLCETIPKVQCFHCLLYWNQGLVYCTCGLSLIDSESRRKFHKLRLDALYHELLHQERAQSWCSTWQNRRTERVSYAWNAWKRCCKTVDSQGELFTGIHDRLLRDPGYRESQLTRRPFKKLTPEERRRYKGQWYFTLNKAGKNGPMKLRSDFRAGVSMKNSSTQRIRGTS